MTISLDDGHSIDNQKQRYSRALTESDNKSIGIKTIGINVDMNIQRTYLYLNDIIHKHRTITKTQKTNGEILKYLYEHHIFLYNPSDINNGNIKTFEITDYYNKEATNLLLHIDDTYLLNDIIITDDDIDLGDNDIALQYTWNDTTKQIETRIINPDLEGEQKHCPKGETVKQYIDIKVKPNPNPNYDTDNDDDNDDDNIDETKTKVVLPTETKLEIQKRILKEVCKRVLFPLLALLSRSFYSLEFKDMLFHSDTKDIVNNILKDKQIILNKNAYNSIIRIMNSNNEIINNIREIYRTAPPDKLHQLIAKHFIPSIEEKKQNAEIPTPIVLVEEMLSKIPTEFWNTSQRVFEPCCGKGNFVMKIFEKFYNGLEALYPDVNIRCIIITQCLYYADLTPLNVFITTEILKCEIQKKTGNIYFDEYIFNNYTGDTLTLDIKKHFNIDGFNAVIGNPPYNDNSGNKGKGHTLWTKFIEISLKSFLNINGYLVYVHPSVWRQIENPCLNLIKDKQLIYLEIHNVDDGQKMFRCATRYDWYVLKNIPYSENTIIKSEDGKFNSIDLRLWQFIPNMMFNEITALMNGDSKLDVWRYRSMYGTENKKLVSKIYNNEFKYLLIYTINKENKITFRYTNNNLLGHFGKTKFIFSNGAGFCCDINGIYGLTEWAYCIYDIKENLKLIESAFRSLKFNTIKNAIQLDSSSYNIKVMKLFKKDFYNVFINDIPTQIPHIIHNTIDNILINNINTIDNTPQLTIFKKGRINYYLIENKLYKIKKDKSQGEYYCDYDNEVIKTTHIKAKRIIKLKNTINSLITEPLIEQLIEQIIEPTLDLVITNNTITQ